MDINLILNVYSEKNSNRNNEFIYCLNKNISNQDIKRIIVLTTEEDVQKIEKNDKIIQIILNKRPTYTDFFSITKNFKENINIISNSDIIIPPETTSKISDYLIDDKICLALTRWDILDLNNQVYKFFNRKDSQDSWFFLGEVNLVADFTLGLPGCDGSIAYLLKKNGYNVLNPSLTLRTYHLHLSNIRNYNKISLFGSGSIFKNKIAPLPYMNIKPTK
jgi:hypothetical protein